MEKNDLEITTESYLNPATLLWKGNEGKKSVEHSCLDLTEYQMKVRSDLQDTPLEEGKLLFVDGSSRVVQEKRHNGCAVVEGARGEVREMNWLPNDWSAQTCELCALHRALHLLKGGEYLPIQSMHMEWYTLLEKFGRSKS